MSTGPSQWNSISRSSVNRRADPPTGPQDVTGAYPIEVHWSAEDDAWIADVPDLPYCTAHGPIPQAIEAWLDAARADGRPILEPSRRAAQA